MNPFRALRFGRRAAKAWDALDDAAQKPVLYTSSAWWTRAIDACADALELAPVPAPLRRLRTMKNWKTTLAGIAALLSVVAKFVQHGTVEPQDIGAVTAGIGLILAKDAGGSAK